MPNGTVQFNEVKNFLRGLHSDAIHLGNAELNRSDGTYIAHSRALRSGFPTQYHGINVLLYQELGHLLLLYSRPQSDIISVSRVLEVATLLDSRVRRTMRNKVNYRYIS